MGASLTGDSLSGPNSRLFSSGTGIRHSLISNPIFWGCVLFGGVVLALDLSTPRSFASGVLYVGVVWNASRLSNTRATIIAAGICTGLTWLGLAWPSSGDDIGEAVFDRVLAMLVIWMTTFFLWWRKDDQLPRIETSGGFVRESEEAGNRLVTNSFLSHKKKGEGNQSGAAYGEVNQRLLTENQELEILVNVMSHDLRSPLVNIQGFSQELHAACEDLRAALDRDSDVESLKEMLAPILDRKIPESLEYIRAGAAKMDSVLSGILQISRLGSINLTVERLDINALVSAVTTSIEFQMKEKGVTLHIHDLPECSGDEALVSQVFSNLLENACKYLDSSRPGMIRVSGRLEDRCVVYSVEDNGIGILPEHQEKIFEMFHRLDRKWGSGEGLGLTIVRRIVDRHQGRVWLTSNRGEGTTFFVTFPRPLNTVRKNGR